MASNPLLKKGFTSGWLQKFFLEPFDPLCIMLAMRTKLLLEVIDEMGHSYNLIRSIGYGWIDWGDIPGEIPGNPGDYYPPQIDNPIIVTPPAGGLGPGAPGYGTPGPGAPGYAPPGPGPGEPGYAPPAPAPTGPGAGYGGGGIGGPAGSMAAPSGFLDQGLWTGPIGSAGGMGGGIDCRIDKDDPSKYVHIGYDTLEMNVNDVQSLTIEGRHTTCEPYHYTWDITQGTGTLDTSEDYGAIYTAPAGGPTCTSPTIINLYCDDELMDTITIVINSCPATAEIVPEKLTMEVSSSQILTAVAGILGCGTPEWEWSITSGGGTLSDQTGDTITYTAAGTNSNCVNNPTITLSCGAVLLDFLELAVNAVTTHTYYAWEEVTFDHYEYSGSPPTWVCAKGYHWYWWCDGTIYRGALLMSNWKAFPGGEAAALAELLAFYPSKDLRTQPAKDAGCCPAVAL